MSVKAILRRSTTQKRSVGSDALVHNTVDARMEAASKAMMRDNQNEAQNKKQDQQSLINILTAAGKGNVLRGWRRELDPQGKMEVEYEDFIQAMVRLRWFGSSHLLFANNKNPNILLLEELTREFYVLEKMMTWVKENFESPTDMFKRFGPHLKTGELTREAFIWSMKLHGAPTLTERELECIYEFCDYGDVGTVKEEDVLSLEIDPKLRAQRLNETKLGQLNAWKNVAAKEYMLWKGIIQGSFSKRSPRHRLAPRPWLAKTFEQMPTVVAHVRAERRRNAYKRAFNARKSFVKHLCKTYGREVRAMRVVLSHDGYSFNKQTLGNYCRKHNVEVDVRDLWKALDQDGDGVVRLEDLCVKTALSLASFQRWARTNPYLGSCMAIWDCSEASAATRAVSGVGWHSGKMMLADTFLDILRRLRWPDLANVEARNQVMCALDPHNAGLISKRDLEWVDRWRPLEWAYAEPDSFAWDQVKKLLIEKYNHPLAAWRSVLDQDDSNSLSWVEFKDALLSLGYEGNIPGAWRHLDEDLSGTISMREYDPESAELLSSFKSWVEANYGSMRHCFRALDADKSGSISFTELKRACHKSGWNGDVRLLFECLDTDRQRDVRSNSKRTLSIDEVAFLDMWQLEPSPEEMEAENAVDAMKKKEVDETTSAAVKKITERLSQQPGPPLRRRHLGKQPVLQAIQRPHSTSGLLSGSGSLHAGDPNLARPHSTACLSQQLPKDMVSQKPHSAKLQSPRPAGPVTLARVGSPQAALQTKTRSHKPNAQRPTESIFEENSCSMSSTVSTSTGFDRSMTFKATRSQHLFSGTGSRSQVASRVGSAEKAPRASPYSAKPKQKLKLFKSKSQMLDALPVLSGARKQPTSPVGSDDAWEEPWTPNRRQDGSPRGLAKSRREGTKNSPGRHQTPLASGKPAPAPLMTAAATPRSTSSSPRNPIRSAAAAVAAAAAAGPRSGSSSSSCAAGGQPVQHNRHSISSSEVPISPASGRHPTFRTPSIEVEAPPFPSPPQTAESGDRKVSGYGMIAQMSLSASRSGVLLNPLASSISSDEMTKMQSTHSGRTPIRASPKAPKTPQHARDASKALRSPRGLSKSPGGSPCAAAAGTTQEPQRRPSRNKLTKFDPKTGRASSRGSVSVMSGDDGSSSSGLSGEDEEDLGGTEHWGQGYIAAVRITCSKRAAAAFAKLADSGQVTDDQLAAGLAHMGHRFENKAWIRQLCSELCSDRSVLDWDDFQSIVTAYEEKYYEDFQERFQGLLLVEEDKASDDDSSEEDEQTITYTQLEELITSMPGPNPMPGALDELLSQNTGVQEHDDLLNITVVMDQAALIVDSLRQQYSFNQSELHVLKTTFYEFCREGTEKIFLDKDTLRQCMLTVALIPQEISKLVDEVCSGNAKTHCDLNGFYAMIRQYHEKQYQHLSEVFARHDAEQSGLLPTSILPQVWFDMGYEVASPALIRECAEHFHVSGKEFVTLSETFQIFQGFGKQLGFFQADLTEVTDAFNRYDTDGSGGISRDELGAVIRWLGYPSSYEQECEIMESFDDDGSGELDRGELCELVHQYSTMEARAVRVFFDEKVSPDFRPSPSEASPDGRLQLTIPEVPFNSSASLRSSLRSESGFSQDEDASQDGFSPGNRASAVCDDEVDQRAIESSWLLTSDVCLPLSFMDELLLSLGHSPDKEQMSKLFEDGGVFPSDTATYWEYLNLVIAYRKMVREKLQQNEGFTNRHFHKLEKIFAKHDPDNTGFIQAGGLKSLLHELFPNINRSSEVHKKAQQLLKVVDANGDGQLEFQEFLRLMRLYQDQVDSDRYRRETDAADANGITRSEMKEYRKLFDSMDHDSRGEVPVMELLKMFKPLLNQKAHTETLSMFHSVDSDKDGHLTFVEFLVAVRKVSDDAAKLLAP